MRTDDLAPLLAKQPTPAVGFRQGVVLAWDPITCQNQVNIGGTVLADLPILNTSEAGILAQGDVVSVFTTGQGAQSWWIIGRATIPNTPQAGTALSAWGARGKLATADANYVFSHTSFAPAADGSGPTITDFSVGNSGQALVFITARLGTPGGSMVVNAFKGTWMSFQLSGPTSIGPAEGRSLEVAVDWLLSTGTAINGGGLNATRMVPLTGLTPGTYSIDARYKVTSPSGGSNDAVAQLRSLFAVPL